MTSTLSHTEYLSRRYFAELDGLRAVSIALVLVWHATEYRYFAWLHGYLGVTIFFVLSGFLITTLLLREEQRTGAVSLRAFYLRRAFRILPLYYLVLALYAFVVVVVQPDVERIEPFLRALPYYVFFLSEYPHFSGYSAPFDLSWSLGIEEKFYLLWPVIAFGISRFHRMRPVMVIVLVALTAALPATWDGTPFLRPYGHILLGCGAALLLHSQRGYDAVRRLGRWQVPLAAGLFLSCVVGGEPFLTPSFELLVALCAGLLLVAVLIADTGPVAAALRTPWLTSIGAVSYGIYLVHQLCLNAMALLIPGTWGVGGAVLLIIGGGGLATLGGFCLAHWIERPLIAVGRRLAERSHSRAATEGSRQTARPHPLPLTSQANGGPS